MSPTKKLTVTKDIVLPVTLVISLIAAAFAGGVFTSDMKNRMTAMESRFDSRMELLATKIEGEMTSLRAQLLLLLQLRLGTGRMRQTPLRTL